MWSSGADHGVFEGDRCDAFVKDLPLERVAADVLIAYEMNGAPLPPENGYPVRLVVPGYYGTNSLKWLIRLTLADGRAAGPFTTRWYNDPILDAAWQRFAATWRPRHRGATRYGLEPSPPRVAGSRVRARAMQFIVCPSGSCEAHTVWSIGVDAGIHAGPIHRFGRSPRFLRANSSNRDAFFLSPL